MAAVATGRPEAELELCALRGGGGGGGVVLCESSKLLMSSGVFNNAHLQPENRLTFPPGRIYTSSRRLMRRIYTMNKEGRVRLPKSSH